MTATALVILILKIEGIALGLVLLTIFGWAAWSRAAARQRARRMSTARAIIAAHLETQNIPPADRARLAGFSSDDLRHFFFEIAPSIGPTERAWLRRLSDDLGEFDALVLETRSGAWWTRLHAARLLTLLDAKPDVMLPLARDPEAVVRAQAASYVAEHGSPEGIEMLIAMLSDPDALCRFAAKDALMRLGGQATPQLVARLTDPAEARTEAILEVAAAIPSHEFLPGAIAHARDLQPQVRLLVARLLRGIGGAAAAQELMRLSADPDPKVRAVAAEAIGYLNHWVASTTVAKLLDDEESRVRLAAALALDRLGPPGELLLRRTRSKGSERAAAAASRILDDPSRAAALLAAGR